jgi:aminopeptidase
VIDPRVANLARILVGYSAKVGTGDTCVISGPTAAEPLIAASYGEVLRAGGHAVVSMSFDGQSELMYRESSDEQLDWISPLANWTADDADCQIVICGDTNTRGLSQVPPERQARRSAATRDLMEKSMKRAADGDFRWVVTLCPTNAYASDAEMSLHDYEDFYFRACFADEEDPVSAWKRAAEEWHRLAAHVQGHEEVRIVAPGTDLRLGIAGREFVVADGANNMPDGEFFTGPIEDSAEGEVTFHLPAVVGGREVAGVRLRFEAGKVVDAHAERGEEYLISMLDTDEGARRLGELGIGTNFGIDRGTREVLLDEKIGGTIHLAVGASYPETGGVNESAVHTDLVCDLRQGGRLEVDGEVVQEDGRFVV